MKFQLCQRRKISSSFSFTWNFNVLKSENNKVGSSRKIKFVCSYLCNVSNMQCVITHLLDLGFEVFMHKYNFALKKHDGKMWAMWIIKAKLQFSRIKWSHWASWREKKAFSMNFARWALRKLSSGCTRSHQSIC